MYNFVRKILLLSLVHFSYMNSIDAMKSSSYEEFQPSSYFGRLSDLNAQLHHFSDLEKTAGARNLSYSLFHIHSHINNLIFSDTGDSAQKISKLIKEKFENGGKNNLYENHGQYESLHLLQDLFSNMDLSAGSTCINDTGRLITSLLEKENWAVQFFDATGKPGPSITELRVRFVGNYDQCLAARAPPVAKDKLGFKGNYFQIIAKMYKFPVEIMLGACLPDTCSPLEISILLNQLLKKQITSKSIQYVYSVDMKVETKETAATKAAISILVIIGSLMISGTLFDLLVIQRPKWTKSNLVTNTSKGDLDGSGNYLSISQTDIDKAGQNREKAPLLPRSDTKTKASSDSTGVFGQVLLSFSVYSNAKKILNTTQAPGSLGAIHGIRFLSMSWVVLCHVFAFCLSFVLNQATALPEFYKRWTALPITNGFVSVDTFFTLSGLLTSYLTIKEMMRRNTWKINWPMFYFHRFWRLTPPYMLVMVIYLGLQQYLGQGPLWSPTQPSDKKNCEDNWWTNLLYVNNLVNFDKGCFGHSWYLANDMQFFVLSPLMMIPFYFHRLAGIFSCCLFLLITTITTGALSSANNWPATTQSVKPVPGRAGPGEWMEHYYIVPWCRIGPFIVGVLAGYVLAVTKGKPFKMQWWVVATGWIVSAASGLAIVYGLYGDIKGDNPSTIHASAFYNAVNRSAWGACISWVIIACSAGYGGPVNKLLSWSPFVVLGRLTYMSYLIHLNIVYIFYENMDNLFYFNDTTMVVTFLGILLFVNLMAFVSVLAFESPMLGLEKTFIKK